MPRLTGDVRLGYEVIVRNDPCIKMPVRLVPAKLTRAKSVPGGGIMP